MSTRFTVAIFLLGLGSFAFCKTAARKTSPSPSTNRHPFPRSPRRNYVNLYWNPIAIYRRWPGPSCRWAAQYTRYSSVII